MVWSFLGAGLSVKSSLAALGGLVVAGSLVFGAGYAKGAKDASNDAEVDRLTLALEFKKLELKKALDAKRFQEVVIANQSELIGKSGDKRRSLQEKLDALETAIRDAGDPRSCFSGTAAERLRDLFRDTESGNH